MSISKFQASALAFAAAFAIGAWAPAAHADPKTLAKVDGVAITEDDVKDALIDLGSSLPEQLQGAERDKYVVNYLIVQKLVAKKAAADKVDQSPEYQRKLDYFKDKDAMQIVLEAASKAAVTDEAEKKTYDEAAAQQPPEPEIHARHILLASEDEAKAALKRVKDGEDFAKVATELSKDKGGGDGGDLGWFTKDSMVPEFSDAAFKLEPGQVSDPVKTQFGWHIIKVEEKRMTSFPPFEQVKDRIAQYLAQKAQTDLIASLRENAKIERFDEAPKPAEPTPSASPSPSASDQPAKP